jgi:hypothetical protein
MGLLTFDKPDKPRKQVYTTEYIQGGRRYGGYLWARDVEHAKQVAGVRGLGEVIEGKYDLYRAPTWRKLRLKRKGRPNEERLHYLTFLAFVALKSKLYAVDAVMGDKGWFHEYIHRLHLVGEPLNKTLKELDADIYTAEILLGFTP